MIRKTLIFWGLTVLASAVKGQAPADSLAMLKATWTFTELSRGVVWKRVHFSGQQLFQSNQHLNLIDIGPRARRIRLGLLSADTPGDTARELLKTSEMALKANALAALNGTFFDTKKYGSVDFIKIGKRVIDTTRYEPGRPLAGHQRAALLLRRGRLYLERAGGPDEAHAYHWERRLHASDIMTSGPLLLWQGRPEALPHTPFNDNRHPRSAVCLTHDGHTLLLAADGRNALAQGLSLPELTYVLQQLGCRTALNLDGGGSTTLYVRGEPEAGVVNMPSDNKRFDHAGERPVSNALMVRKKGWP